MMRKLLYSFLFFISSRSLSKRLCKPSLGLLCVGMFFVFSNNYGQCSFGGTQSGTNQSIIYNRENVSGTNIGAVTFTGVPVGRYVGVNVIQGLTYTITTTSNQSFTKRITLFNQANTGTSLGTATSNSNSFSVGWTATFTGTLFVRINNSANCSSTTGNNSTIAVSYTGGNNTTDKVNENAEGTNSWIAHVYDFPDTVTTNPLSDANAFTNSSYLGYFTQANTVTGNTTSFVQDYGGGLTPNVTFTGVGASRQFYGETFAVRYRMRSTLPAGCYFVKVKGDDGVKLSIDGVKVFDAWVLQGPTEYTNILVYLNGNSQLVLDYYDYDEANVTEFSIYPADDTINSVNGINTAGPVYRCANSGNTVLDGSAITYQGANSNPSIKFQWQSSPDNVNWTDINTNGTGENYTVAGTNPGSTTIVYYRRNVIGAAANAASCIYSTESIAVITSRNSNAGTPTSSAATNMLCNQFTANWAALGTASGYYLDVSTNNSFSSFVSGYSNLDVGLVTSYNVTGLNPNTTYYYRLRAYNKCSGSTPTTSSTVVSASTTSSTANAGGTLAAICQGATSAQMGGSVGGGATGGTWTGGSGTWTNPTNPLTATYTAGASESGNITLTLTTSGGSCGTATAIKTITVNPNPTATAGSALSAICQGGTSAAMGGSVGGGATGGTWTGGSGTWTNAGNPATATYRAGASESGSITLTLTTSGGSCGTATATKTITVNPINTITLTSAAGTNAQSICFNSAITDITYATTGGTVLTTSGFPLGLTISWFGGVVRISGTPTVSSASPYNYTVALQGNCETVTLSGTITVKPLPTAPTITKNNDVSCNTLGSITLAGLPADWTITRTGVTTSTQPYTGTTSTLPIEGLVVDTYSFTVTNNATGCTSSPATVTITDTSSNTDWNGSAWSNLEPDGSKSVTISSVVPNQPFTIEKPNIQACSLTITSTSDVIIPDGVTLTITNKVTTNGKLVFESGSSLLQTTNVQNEGTIVYKRATEINRFDLTYWSSPVTGEPDTFKMKDLSPTTLFDKFFTYSPTGGWATNMYGEATMLAGHGYSIRGPQEFDKVDPDTFIGKFTGIPNNGDITVTPVVEDKFFLLGNPYPSAIDVDALWDANPNQLGALYFWTHVAPPTKAPGENTYRYTSNDYVVYTASGGTVVSGTKSFDGYIAAGQGFFARPKATEIHFNNDMRRGSSVNGSFFKVANKSKSIERNRIWLNMVNNEGAFKQILVGYIEGATNNVDFNYDAPTIAGNSYLDFYSLNETKKLTIQGRALPFENTDLVPLGYKTTVASDFTIGLDHGDGFFNKQEVYLEDKTTGKTTNLRNENYTFSTLVGTFTDRFVLRYTGKTLGTDDLENLENSVLIAVKNKTVSITCSKETIKEVNIFNVGAQLVYSKNKVNSSELQITNLHSSDQVLLVKVTLENGSVITKKVIFSNL